MERPGHAQVPFVKVPEDGRAGVAMGGPEKCGAGRAVEKYGYENL
jgi:hypothetical protein